MTQYKITTNSFLPKIDNRTIGGPRSEIGLVLSTMPNGSSVNVPKRDMKSMISALAYQRKLKNEKKFAKRQQLNGSFEIYRTT